MFSQPNPYLNIKLNTAVVKQTSKPLAIPLIDDNIMKRGIWQKCRPCEVEIDEGDKGIQGERASNPCQKADYICMTHSARQKCSLPSEYQIQKQAKFSIAGAIVST